MPRDRHQLGWVEETGSKSKKWKGHYYVYLRELDGSERRAHRSVILGTKSQMKKWEAQKKLEGIIAEAAGSVQAKPSSAVTLAWFWKERFLPIKAEKWKTSSRNETVRNIERYVIEPLGEAKLEDIDKFTVQKHINALAKEYSKSVVEKAFIWSRAVLEEAVDQEFLAKNPARKLEMPETRKVVRKTVDVKVLAATFSKLPLRERLMLRIALVLGLRPGEIMALRWDDVFIDSLRIDEGAVDGKIYSPKTDASISHVWMPSEVAVEVDFWRCNSTATKPEDFIFQRQRGEGPMHLDSYRKHELKPALEAAGLKGITFQQCRRTCGTLMLKHGNLKDVQGHLRHAQASTTLGIYVQQIPESVRLAVQSLDHAIFGNGTATPAASLQVN